MHGIWGNQASCWRSWDPAFAPASMAPQHYVGADSRSAISRIADQNYDVLIELDLAAFAPNGVPALQVPQGFAGDGWQENRQFFRNDSAAFQGPYIWPNAVHADAVIGNSVHLPGWVPALPAASESDEHLDIVTRASRLSQHFYRPESDQTMGFGMPLEDGDNGVLNPNVIDLVESEPHAVQSPSQYQEIDSVGPFRCVLCNTTIKRKSDYQRHMKTTMQGEAIQATIIRIAFVLHLALPQFDHIHLCCCDLHKSIDSPIYIPDLANMPHSHRLKVKPFFPI
ncbi:hypothetical protein F5887DRAFT_917945 [Amanita rubescens]|nr:hypothetical protein F5887DRAFT_917945 [Amanita rubescens]